MNMLFGKGPTPIQSQTNIQAGGSHDSGSNNNNDLYSDVQVIVDTIWKNINKESDVAIIKPFGHNSMVNADIYELDFSHLGHNCVIMFNDLPGDDNFTAKIDMDSSADTPDDIYEFIIDYIHDTETSPIHKFVVKRGHPSETGVLHFREISSDEVHQVVQFVKSCIAPSD